ncbi:MAG: ATP-binding cassette domain-containing protein, partial [Niameybacter sp.]
MENSILNVSNLSFYYGDFKALKNINMEVKKNEVLAFIGPSGCGKSTFLRILNRMSDLVEDTKVDGSIT